jgi:hypothetical protein
MDSQTKIMYKNAVLYSNNTVIKKIAPTTVKVA